MPASNQGAFQNRYMVIPRVLIFSTCEDQVLLIQGSQRKRLWAGLYNGIGGHIEQGEDVLAAAQREFSEETGLELSDIWLCGIIMIDTKTNPGIVVFVFRGYFPQFPVVQDQTLWDHSTEGVCEWVPINSLGQFPLVEDLPVILPRILAAKQEEPPFYAIYSYNERDGLVIKINGNDS